MSYFPLIETRPRRVIPLTEPVAPVVQPTDASMQALAVKQAVDPPAINLNEVKQAAMPDGWRPLREPPTTQPVTIAPLNEPPVVSPAPLSIPGPSLDAGQAPLPKGYLQDRLQESLPSYKGYLTEKAALPSEQDYIQSHTPHGFGHRVLGVLGATGKAALRGGPVAGLAMGVEDAIDPAAGPRADYRVSVEPRSFSRQQRLLGQAGAEMSLSDRMLDNDRADRQMLINEDYKNSAMQSLDERRDAQARNDAAKRALDAFDAWAKYAAPGSKVPDSIAIAAGMPQGATVWHNQNTGEHYVKGPDGRTVQLRNGVGYPVNYDGGGPVIQDATQPAPHYISGKDAQGNDTVFEVTPGKGGKPPAVRTLPITPKTSVDHEQRAAQIRSQVKAEFQQRGLIDSDGYMANPNASPTAAEQKQIRRAARDGADAGEAERQRIMRSKRVKPEDSPAFKAEVDRRVGQSNQHGGPGPASQPPAQQAAADESWYQQNYSKMSLEDRTMYEGEFARHYGRAPKVKR